MTCVFRDSFDQYNGTGVTNGLQAKYPSATYSLITGRFGTGQAISSTPNTGVRATLDSAVSSFTMQGAIRVPSGIAPAAVRTMLVFLNGSTFMCGLNFCTDGSIEGRRVTASTTATVLGSSSTGAFTLNAWHEFAIEVVISDTVGRITVYIDDWSTPVLNLTNVDTRNGTPTTINVWGMNSTSSTAAFDLDDIWIEDSATRLAAPIRAETIYPDSDGGTLNWTPSTGTSHYAVVDETLASDTDYLTASTVGNADELGVSNLSTTPVSIQAATVVAFAQKTDAAVRALALGVKSGATTSDGSDFTLSTTTLRYERNLDVDPNTGVAWTASGINALQLRPKVTV